MKRVTQGGDINFDTTSVRGLGQTYTIKFYTINVNNYIMKTNTDVVNGIIALNWSELETLGGGVLNFMVDDNTADPEYSDGTYNRTFSGTTEYYIDMPLSEGGGGGDVDALTLRLNAEITRSIAKDNELSAAISNEATARENADSALSDRITANATAIANTYTKTEIDNMLDDIDIDLPENIVIDANYVHTDNNYTTNEKNKLTELHNYDDSSLSSRVSTLENAGYTTNIGTITGIIMNGATKGTSGVVDLGTVLTEHQSLSGKQDTLVDAVNIKLINGESILGSGNLDITQIIYGKLVQGQGLTRAAFYPAMGFNPISNQFTFSTESVTFQQYMIYVDVLTNKLYLYIGRTLVEINDITVDTTITENGANPVTGGAIYSAFQNVYTKTEVDDMFEDVDVVLPDNIVIDANYVHTDNNYTTTEKNKLAELDGKQYTILYLTKKSGNIYTFKDEDGNTLTYSDLKPILLEKDVTVNFRNNIYYCFIISIDEDEGFYDAFFGFKSLNSNILNLEIELEEYDGEEPIFSVYESTENVHDTFYGICTTAATNSNKLAYPTGFVLREGNIVSIKFNNDVYTGATLNCNNTGAKAIRHRGSAIESMVIRGGDVATFMYYSGVYNLISVDRVNKEYIQAFSSQLNPNQNRVEYTLSQFGTYRLAYPTTTTGYDLYITLSDEGGNVVPEHTILFDGTELSGKGSVIFTNTLVWENNDDPTAQDDVFDHLGQTVNYVVVKIYETKYASYKAW